MKIKCNSQVVKFLGFVVFGVGAICFVQDYTMRHVEGAYPFNPGIVLADSAIALLGSITLIVAECLNTIEERLGKLDGNKSGR
jgi:hypothetical protein